MDIAVKKVELIEWLVRLQDEKMIHQLEKLKSVSIRDEYDLKIPKTIKDVKAKLNQSQKDLNSGNIHSQQEVEAYFEKKVTQ
jgi:hypothetical protein